VFWSLSLAEWRALMAPVQHPALSRAAFETLKQTYPD
jgi:hypothetical protein